MLAVKWPQAGASARSRSPRCASMARASSPARPRHRRPQCGRAVARLGVASLAQRVSQPGDGEYYWVDLIGLDVVNRDGAALGRVIGLIDTGPHCVFRIAPVGAVEPLKPDQERLIPFRWRLRRRCLDLRCPADQGRLGSRLLMRFDVITLFLSCSTPIGGWHHAPAFGKPPGGRASVAVAGFCRRYLPPR